jgi:hypothetical protein
LARVTAGAVIIGIYALEIVGGYTQIQRDQRKMQLISIFISMELKSTKEKLKYKQGLKAQCVALLRDRVDTARQSMEAAQESANNEGKSSAGDKYETGRAMSQIDRDRSAGQMDDAVQEMLRLQSIDSDRLYKEVNNGAVVMCGDAIYFIAIGLGAIHHEGQKVIVLSPKAPLSNLLRGKVKGDKVTFNGNNFEITDLF